MKKLLQLRRRSVWFWALTAAFLVGQIGIPAVFGQSRVDFKRSDDRREVMEVRHGNGGIEVSPNGCVVYLTSNSPNIKRVDVCSNQTLPDFNRTVLPDEKGAKYLRLLPDGGMLVADNSVIARLDASGNLVQTYDSAEKDCWSGIAFEAGSRSFWGSDACAGTAVQFNLDTAETVQAFVSTDMPRTETSSGRFFGGGTEFTSNRTEVHHGIDLHCDTNVKPNYLQVVWQNYVFMMTSLSSVSCTNDPTIQSNTSFNTISGVGIGTLNGVGAMSVEFTFVDGGQPGAAKDKVQIVIRGGLAMTVLDVSGRIWAGTHIARDQ